MGLGAKRGQRQPTEAPNTLLSTSYAKLLFLLCAGQVRGWVGAELGNALYIDGVPLLSPGGTPNFRGWETYFREGTENQGYIPGLDFNSEIRQVNQQVRNNIDVTRIITNPDVDAVDVVIRIPSLYKREDNQDIVGTEVRYQILYRSGTNSYTVAVDQTIQDKANSPAQRSHHIQLQGEAPWDLRVKRITADSTDESTLQNRTEWEYLTEIEYEKRDYSGSCVVGLHIDVNELESVSGVKVLVDAQYVLIPHNYDPDARSYDGLFDGSLVKNWTNSPVWIALDILLNRIPLSAVNLFEWYDAALYCDETVNGGPRFTFNHVFNDRSSTFSQARKVVGTFNGQLVERGNKISLFVDKPANSKYNFDVDEMTVRPSYLATSSLEVSTICTVTYKEPQQNYENVSFTVIDQPGRDRFDDKEINLEAFGCTSRDQAARTALWTMASPRLSPLIVRFQLSLAGKALNLGDVFIIRDPRRDKAKTGGRLLSYTSAPTGDQITLDFDYTFTGGLIYDIFLLKSDGLFQAYEINPELTTAVNATTANVVLRTANPVPSDVLPLPGDPFFIKARDVVTGYEWRATKITPVNGKHSHFDIEAILYNESKYDYVDTNGASAAGNYSSRSTPSVTKAPGTPFGLQTVEGFFTDDNGLLIFSTVLSWSYPLNDNPQLEYFEVETKQVGDVAWTPQGTTKSRSLPLPRVDSTAYDFRVSAVSRLGERSDWGYAESRTDGVSTTTGAPESVSNLTLARIEEDTIQLKWDPIEDSTVRSGGYIRIRHTPRIINANWDTGTLVTTVQGSTDNKTLPYLEGTYLVRTYNRNGTPSALPSRVLTSLAGAAFSNRTQIHAFDESPAFAGVKDGTKIVGGKLRIGNQDTWNTIPTPFNALPAPLNDWGAGINQGDGVGEGYYYFNADYELDPTTPQRFYLYPYVDVAIIRIDQIWNNLNNGGPFNETPIADILGTAGTNENTDYGEKPSAKIQISLSLDGAVTFSDWVDLIPGEFFATHIKARLHIEGDSPAVLSEVETLQLLVLSATN